VSPKPAIAVLGTGTIGFPVARNLARAGFDVRAWNRTREKAEPLSAGLGLALILPAIGTLVLGIFPGWVLDFAGRSSGLVK